jgi:hypothetical protein
LANEVWASPESLNCIFGRQLEGIECRNQFSVMDERPLAQALRFKVSANAFVCGNFFAEFCHG